jgi:sugar O-acyltransferase (sialic acid O-acetyltransferase NeuD family)
MPTNRIILVGAGGHGSVVYEAIRLSDKWELVELRDDRPVETGNKFDGLEVRVPAIPAQPLTGADVHVGIGNNAIRERISAALRSLGAQLVAIVHPSASIASTASISAGTFVAARAVIAPHAILGEGTIVNHGAVVDHDCVLGSWTHVAPGVLLGGGVSVGSSALIGAGSIVLPGLQVGDGAIVGAGAVVTRPVEAGSVVVGIPARRI